MIVNYLQEVYSMKKTFILFLIGLSLILVGCGSNSVSSSNLKNGQSIILPSDTPVASSKENVDKIISYVKNKNGSALNNMELQGDATVLSKGTKVNVVKVGIVTEIETEQGIHWFAPIENFK
jgi:hypothetical protein